MSSLPPVVSKRETLRAFQRAGWVVVEQKGSHMLLCRNGQYTTLTGVGSGEMNLGSLRGALRKAGISVDEFVELLKER